LRPSYLHRGLAAFIALALAGCAETSGPPQRKGPYGGVDGGRASVDAARLDSGLAAQASAFEAYTRKAAAIDANFSGPAEIGQALQTAAGYEPKQLEAGMIAYAALAALQDPQFVATVRRGGPDLGRRLANSREWPTWKPGSEFKAARDRTAAARK